MTNRFFNSVACVIAAAGLAGCASPFNGPEHAFSVEKAHPISVDSQIVTLTIDADATTTDLSNIDKARLRSFADAYLRSGHGPLAITAPSGGSEDFDGQEAAADIRQQLLKAGVPYSRMSGATYRASGGQPGQITLSYTHYVATPSPCGVWAEARLRDYRNLPMPNFGCATQNNLAAMLADPHDLIAPADQDYPDAASRIRGVRAYRQGEVSATETDGDIRVELSEQ